MEVQLKIVKRLPDKSGTNENGNWLMGVFICEFTEETINAPVLHAVILEVSDKKWDLAKIEGMIAKGETTPANIHLDVRSYESKYYPEVSVYLKNPVFQKPREY